MRTTLALLSWSFSAGALTIRKEPAPLPKIFDVTYWGSACPEGGLDAVIGPVNATTNIAPLSFTLENFRPTLGDFGSTLRMCNIDSMISVAEGWKVKVNARGTFAQGNADLPENATMFLRSTYFFAEKGDLKEVSDILAASSARILRVTRASGCWM
jgi:hypothetical protein